jgi:hypothetical protein
VSLKKNLHSLRHTSFLAILCIIYLSIVIISKASWTAPCSKLDLHTSYFKCTPNQCSLTSVPTTTTYNGILSCFSSCQGATDEPKMSSFMFDFKALMALPLFSFAVSFYLVIFTFTKLSIPFSYIACNIVYMSSAIPTSH